jgi:hypothetical protein
MLPTCDSQAETGSLVLFMTQLRQLWQRENDASPIKQSLKELINLVRVFLYATYGKVFSSDDIAAFLLRDESCLHCYCLATADTSGLFLVYNINQNIRRVKSRVAAAAYSYPLCMSTFGC